MLFKTSENITFKIHLSTYTITMIFFLKLCFPHAVKNFHFNFTFLFPAIIYRGVLIHNLPDFIPKNKVKILYLLIYWVIKRDPSSYQKKKNCKNLWL